MSAAYSHSFRPTALKPHDAELHTRLDQIVVNEMANGAGCGWGHGGSARIATKSKTDALDAQFVRLTPNIVERRLEKEKSCDACAR